MTHTAPRPQLTAETDGHGRFAPTAATGRTRSTESLRAEIDTINADVFQNVNNAVYRAGFATTQAAYEEAVHALFDALDRLEMRLGTTTT